MRTPQAAAGNYFGNIESLKSRKDPEALKSAAKELEALFAYEMIKAMRETSDISGGGLGKDTYMSMFDMELSRLFAERGLGLKELLLKGLNRQADKGQGETKVPGVKEEGQKRVHGVMGSGVQEKASVTQNSVSVGQESRTSDEKMPVRAQKTAPDVPGSPEPPNPWTLSDEEPSMPVDGRISSGFGMRTHPIHGGRRFHHGMDIAAPEGTEIYPFRGGKVIFSGEYNGYGNMVMVDHGDGIISRYAHNRINLVKQGDIVGPDTVIAEVGSTGISTGPHLHFEVRQDGRPLDPAKVLAMR